MSDLRAIFGHVRQTRPLFRNSAFRRNVPVKGVNVALLKSNALLCARCNNQLTQPHDQAWERLSEFLRSKSCLRAGARVDLSKVFPGAVRRSMLDVHLYFVKLFGCLVAENRLPIDLRVFSSCIRNGTPHPCVHLAISPYIDGVSMSSAGYSDIETAQIDGKIVYATWLYILDKFSIRVMYAEPTERRKGLIDSWHPSTIHKLLRVSGF